MKIALFGASGTLGQRILHEALKRGHEVLALVRNPEKSTLDDPRVTARAVNALNPSSIAEAVAGQDIVISAIGPAGNQPVAIVVDAARSLLIGVARAGVPRLITVGGAGSLEVAPGVKLMNTSSFPEGWKPIAQAHSDALDIYRREIHLNWTYVSPAGFIAPGERTGKYRTGTDQLVTDEKGESRISAEDFAVAILDEVEKPRFDRQRFTVAY